MRRVHIIFLSLLFLMHCSSVKDSAGLSGQGEGNIEEHRTVLKVDGMILGEFDISDIRTEEFPWFDKNFVGYDIDQMKLNQIRTRLQDIKILCFAGTWCSDTHRELPRMWRILFDAQADPDIMKMYGIDRNKMSPNGEAAMFQIKLSPTFIFLRNGVELGRIEEQPRKSLESDMLDIITK